MSKARSIKRGNWFWMENEALDELLDRVEGAAPKDQSQRVGVGNVLLVYNYLCRHCNNQSQLATIARNQLAAKLRISESTAVRSLDFLLKLKAIEKVKRRRADLPNTYRLLPLRCVATDTMDAGMVSHTDTTGCIGTDTTSIQDSHIKTKPRRASRSGDTCSYQKRFTDRFTELYKTANGVDPLWPGLFFSRFKKKREEAKGWGEAEWMAALENYFQSDVNLAAQPDVAIIKIPNYIGGPVAFGRLKGQSNGKTYSAQRSENLDRAGDEVARRIIDRDLSERGSAAFDFGDVEEDL